MEHLSIDEINQIFINANLEENYNFIQDDLVKLALAYIHYVEPRIVAEERNACIEVVKVLNREVAAKLAEVRANG
jgi:hypothetical protein